MFVMFKEQGVTEYVCKDALFIGIFCKDGGVLVINRLKYFFL